MDPAACGVRSCHREVFAKANVTCLQTLESRNLLRQEAESRHGQRNPGAVSRLFCKKLTLFSQQRDRKRVQYLKAKARPA
jgi:hypothetical protein